MEALIQVLTINTVKFLSHLTLNSNEVIIKKLQPVQSNNQNVEIVRELSVAYPHAKFVHTVRSPESWAASFSETIYKLVANKDQAPKEMHNWLDMAARVTEKTGFPGGLDIVGLIKAFTTHTEAVKKAVPASNLLMFQVKDGWEPLCEFLGVPVPDKPFPRSNNRGEFWDRVSGKK